MGKKLFESTATLNNVTYTDALSNVNSPEFQKLAKEFCEAIKAVYTSPSSPIQNEYEDCEVLEFRSGSLVVKFRIGANSYSEKTVDRKLLDQLKIHFQNMIAEKGKWNVLRVDETKIQNFVEVDLESNLRKTKPLKPKFSQKDTTYTSFDTSQSKILHQPTVAKETIAIKSQKVVLRSDSTESSTATPISTYTPLVSQPSQSQTTFASVSAVNTGIYHILPSQISDQTIMLASSSSSITMNPEFVSLYEDTFTLTTRIKTFSNSADSSQYQISLQPDVSFSSEILPLSSRDEFHPDNLDLFEEKDKIFSSIQDILSHNIEDTKRSDQELVTRGMHATKNNANIFRDDLSSVLQQTLEFQSTIRSSETEKINYFSRYETETLNKSPLLSGNSVTTSLVQELSNYEKWTSNLSTSIINHMSSNSSSREPLISVDSKATARLTSSSITSSSDDIYISKGIPAPTLPQSKQRKEVSVSPSSQFFDKISGDSSKSEKGSITPYRQYDSVLDVNKHLTPIYSADRNLISVSSIFSEIPHLLTEEVLSSLAAEFKNTLLTESMESTLASTDETPSKSLVISLSDKMQTSILTMTQMHRMPGDFKLNTTAALLPQSFTEKFQSKHQIESSLPPDSNVVLSKQSSLPLTDVIKIKTQSTFGAYVTGVELEQSYSSPTEIKTTPISSVPIESSYQVDIADPLIESSFTENIKDVLLELSSPSFKTRPFLEIEDTNFLIRQTAHSLLEETRTFSLIEPSFTAIVTGSLIEPSLEEIIKDVPTEQLLHSSPLKIQTEHSLLEETKSFTLIEPSSTTQITDSLIEPLLEEINKDVPTEQPLYSSPQKINIIAEPSLELGDTNLQIRPRTYYLLDETKMFAPIKPSLTAHITESLIEPTLKENIKDVRTEQSLHSSPLKIQTEHSLLETKSFTLIEPSPTIQITDSLIEASLEENITDVPTERSFYISRLDITTKPSLDLDDSNLQIWQSTHSLLEQSSLTAHISDSLNDPSLKENIKDVRTEQSLHSSSLNIKTDPWLVLDDDTKLQIRQTKLPLLEKTKAFTYIKPSQTSQITGLLLDQSFETNRDVQTGKSFESLQMKEKTGLSSVIDDTNFHIRQTVHLLPEETDIFTSLDPNFFQQTTNDLNDLPFTYNKLKDKAITQTASSLPVTTDDIMNEQPSLGMVDRPSTEFLQSLLAFSTETLIKHSPKTIVKSSWMIKSTSVLIEYPSHYLTPEVIAVSQIKSTSISDLGEPSSYDFQLDIQTSTQLKSTLSTTVTFYPLRRSYSLPYDPYTISKAKSSLYYQPGEVTGVEESKLSTSAEYVENLIKPSSGYKTINPSLHGSIRFFESLSDSFVSEVQTTTSAELSLGLFSTVVTSYTLHNESSGVQLPSTKDLSTVDESQSQVVQIRPEITKPIDQMIQGISAELSSTLITQNTFLLNNIDHTDLSLMDSVLSNKIINLESSFQVLSKISSSEIVSSSYLDLSLPRIPPNSNYTKINAEDSPLFEAIHKSLLFNETNDRKTMKVSDIIKHKTSLPVDKSVAISYSNNVAEPLNSVKSYFASYYITNKPDQITTLSSSEVPITLNETVIQEHRSSIFSHVTPLIKKSKILPMIYSAESLVFEPIQSSYHDSYIQHASTLTFQSQSSLLESSMFDLMYTSSVTIDEQLGFLEPSDIVSQMMTYKLSFEQLNNHPTKRYFGAEFSTKELVTEIDQSTNDRFDMQIDISATMASTYEPLDTYSAFGLEIAHTRENVNSTYLINNDHTLSTIKQASMQPVYSIRTSSNVTMAESLDTEAYPLVYDSVYLNDFIESITSPLAIKPVATEFGGLSSSGLSQEPNIFDVKSQNLDNYIASLGNESTVSDFREMLLSSVSSIEADFNGVQPEKTDDLVGPFLSDTFQYITNSRTSDHLNDMFSQSDSTFVSSVPHLEQNIIAVEMSDITSSSVVVTSTTTWPSTREWKMALSLPKLPPTFIQRAIANESFIVEPIGNGFMEPNIINNVNIMPTLEPSQQSLQNSPVPSFTPVMQYRQGDFLTQTSITVVDHQGYKSNDSFYTQGTGNSSVQNKLQTISFSTANDTLPSDMFEKTITLSNTSMSKISIANTTTTTNTPIPQTGHDNKAGISNYIQPDDTMKKLETFSNIINVVDAVGINTPFLSQIDNINFSNIILMSEAPLNVLPQTDFGSFVTTRTLVFLETASIQNPLMNIKQSAVSKNYPTSIPQLLNMFNDTNTENTKNKAPSAVFQDTPAMESTDTPGLNTKLLHTSTVISSSLQSYINEINMKEISDFILPVPSSDLPSSTTKVQQFRFLDTT